MQETLNLDSVECVAAVHKAEGTHVAEWQCGACQGSGKATGSTSELALNPAKANLLVHHAFAHCSRD